MKTIISIGDFIDIYHKLLLKGPRFFLSRFAFSNISRVRNAWEQSPSPPIHWWSIPRVRERWNQMITGNSTIDYPEYVVNKYFRQKRNLRLISPGCGYGSIEIEFAKYDHFARIEGFDLSPRRIHLANENAKKSGYSKLVYFVNDVYKYDFGHNRYDIILFHSSLHHIRNINNLLKKIHDSLTTDGLLIINEYVGPNRFQWEDKQLERSNHYLDKIPSGYRKLWQSSSIKTKIYRPGYLRMILSDSSEAVNSEEIIPEIRLRFKRLEVKPYGGNLLHLIFKDISHNFVDDTNEVNEILNNLFKVEDDFIKDNNKSDFIFGVYTK